MADDPVTMENVLDHVPLCGCGNPEAGMALILELLQAAPFHSNRERLLELLPDLGTRMVVLGALDEHDLIEHGTSIEGSWLTERGKQVLAVLEPHEASDFEELLP